MIASNVGPSAPKGKVCLRVDMEAYDDLPPLVRARLQNMTENWNASGARAIMRKHGERMVVHVLDKVEGDVQSAMQERIEQCLAR